MDHSHAHVVPQVGFRDKLNTITSAVALDVFIEPLPPGSPRCYPGGTAAGSVPSLWSPRTAFNQREAPQPGEEDSPSRGKQSSIVINPMGQQPLQSKRISSVGDSSSSHIRRRKLRVKLGRNLPVRTGVDLGSDEIGVLAIGTIVTVVEEHRLPGGNVRGLVALDLIGRESASGLTTDRGLTYRSDAGTHRTSVRSARSARSARSTRSAQSSDFGSLFGRDTIIIGSDAGNLASVSGWSPRLAAIDACDSAMSTWRGRDSCGSHRSGASGSSSATDADTHVSWGSLGSWAAWGFEQAMQSITSIPTRTPLMSNLMAIPEAEAAELNAMHVDSLYEQTSRGGKGAHKTIQRRLDMKLPTHVAAAAAGAALCHRDATVASASAKAKAVTDDPHPNLLPSRWPPQQYVREADEQADTIELEDGFGELPQTGWITLMKDGVKTVR